MDEFEKVYDSEYIYSLQNTTNYFSKKGIEHFLEWESSADYPLAS